MRRSGWSDLGCNIVGNCVRGRSRPVQADENQGARYAGRLLGRVLKIEVVAEITGWRVVIGARVHELVGRYGTVEEVHDGGIKRQGARAR